MDLGLPSPTFDIWPGAGPAPGRPRAALVLLHGREMRADVLRPFVQALHLPLVASVPDGPCRLPDGSRAWWPLPTSAGQGPGLDLVDRTPARREAARAQLDGLLAGLRAQWPGLPVIVAGYSQGGMLALDQLFLGAGPRPDGLMLISTSRIARSEWAPHWAKARDLPVLVMHGRQDPEIPLAAGRALHDALSDAGARSEWKEHEGGHAIPMSAWRALKRFIEARWAA